MTEYEAAVDRFRTLLRIPTISHRAPERTDSAAFERFIEALHRLYPLVHSRLELTRHAGQALLFRWAGREPGEATVLMAHYDVVPVDGQHWSTPPFAAEVSDIGGEQCVVSRGAFDDKGALVAILEAVEEALDTGVVPRNDVYLAFGHNEEIGGDGAPSIVAYLQQQRVRARLVIDEGGAIGRDFFPGLSSDIAVVGVTERGYADVTITAREPGGHSSTPPAYPATARLAHAITRLQRRPMPPRVPATTRAFLSRLGGLVSGPIGLLLRRIEITWPLVARALRPRGGELAALMGTTMVVTRLAGSPAANTLASEASAVINVRIQPGDTVSAVVTHIAAVIGPELDISVAHPVEPPPVSRWDDDVWQLLEDALRASHGEVIAVPYVQLGGSDGKLFSPISDHVYRLMPFRVSRRTRDGLHSADEHLSIRSWREGIRFYREIIERS